jgi:hypothetical protein
VKPELGISDIDLLKYYPPSISWPIRSLLTGDIRDTHGSISKPEGYWSLFAQLNGCIRMCLNTFRAMQIRHVSALTAIHESCTSQYPLGLYLRDNWIGKYGLTLGRNKQASKPSEETAYLESAPFYDAYLQQALLLATAHTHLSILEVQDFLSIDHYAANPNKVLLPGLLLQESAWRTGVEKLISCCGIIFLAVHHLSEGTKFEIEMIRRCNKQAQTVVIHISSEGYAANFSFVRELFSKTTVSADLESQNAPPISDAQIQSSFGDFPHVIKMRPDAIESNAITFGPIITGIAPRPPLASFEDIRNSLGSFGIRAIIDPAILSQCEEGIASLKEYLENDLHERRTRRVIIAHYQMLGLLLTLDQLGGLPLYLLRLAWLFRQLGQATLSDELQEVTRDVFVDMDFTADEGERIVRSALDCMADRATRKLTHDP